jgi:dTDP-glucose 4,6-dehydratase
MPRSVVLGGAGFLGSHICDRLVARGDDVVAVDDLSSGSLRNLGHLTGGPNFRFVRADICDGIPVNGQVDYIFNFASLASPPRYSRQPIHTLRTGATGTENALTLATNSAARLVMASTSEVYGDPTVHPQSESYWGNVNPIGPRSCYDEAKRYAEALCVAFEAERGANVGILRIFNTYGPRLDPADGRVVSNFIGQALAGNAMTIYGDGTQTRSFCFVDDLIDAVLMMAETECRGPVNIGTPNEQTMLELASTVNKIASTNVPLSFMPLPQDDPTQRCPDITMAREMLGWEPSTSLEEGLSLTIDWFRRLHD